MIEETDFLDGISGTIDKRSGKHYRTRKASGRIYCCSNPHFSKPRSALQVSRNNNFKSAMQEAKNILNTPDKLAMYKDLAELLNMEINGRRYRRFYNFVVALCIEDSNRPQSY